MPTALFLSPHLDDVAFSCGGVAARLADAGWRTVLATAFTGSVCPAEGFALACQLDKGLAAEVDYMALRRDEDAEAAAILGICELRWLGLLEAPHRGYESAAALFGPVRADDDIWRTLAEGVAGLLRETAPDIVFAPQGLGGHVDHRQLIRAICGVVEPARLVFYRDTPYAIRDPAASPDPLVTASDVSIIEIAANLPRKIAASAAYRSQVGFQFGGAAGVGRALRDFAYEEGHEKGNGVAAERFLGRIAL